MAEVYQFSKNTAPYAAVLCHSADRAAVAPIFDRLSAHGLKLCVLNEQDQPGSRLERACAVIAVFSQSFGSSEVLQTAFFKSQQNEIPLVPVQLERCALPEVLERTLFALNAVYLTLYPEPEAAAERILSATALQEPKVTDRQKKAYRRLQVLMGLAAAAVVIFAVLFVFLARANTVRLTEEQKGALAVYGLTEADLKEIRVFVLAGDRLEYSGGESQRDEEGDLVRGRQLIAERYLFWDEEWHANADGTVLADGTVEDLSFLALLPNLQELVLVKQTAQLPELSGLTKLEYVELVECEQESLSFLSGCKGLKSLALYNCPGLNTLEGLSSASLERVELYLSGLRDFQALEECPALTELSLRSGYDGAGENTIEDISRLKALNHLKRLVIADRPELENLDFVSEMPELTHIALVYCENLQEIRAVAQCGKLVEFNLVQEEEIRYSGDYGYSHDRNTMDFTPLSGLEQLVDICLQGITTNLDFLLPIADHDFYRLSFSGANLELSGLGAVKKCEYLEILDTGETDNLPFLRNINVENLALFCNAGGHYNLNDLPVGITSLTLVGYQGESLSGLEQQTELKELSLNDARNLCDFSALQGLKLRALGLIGLPNLPDFSKIAFEKNAYLMLNVCLQDGKPLRTLEALNALPDEYAQGAGLTLEILEPDLEDISALERFQADALILLPGWETEGERLVKQGCFRSFSPAVGFEPNESETGERDEAAELTPYMIHSLEELYTVSDSDALRVMSLTIVGGEVLDMSSGECLSTVRNAKGGYSFAVFNGRTGTERPLTEGGLSDLSVLQRFPNLQELTLCAQPVADLTGLRGLEQLWELKLYGLPLQSLDGLQHLSGLDRITICGCGLTEITPVFALQGLRSIQLQEAGVTQLQGIQNLNRLNYLDLGESGVTDISALEGIGLSHSSEGLTLLLPWAQVRDLSPLSAVRHYSALYISGYSYSTWRGVLDGCEVEKLVAYGCFANDGEYEELAAAVTGLRECER